MSKAEQNDILDQHKKVYDGFVTQYGQQVNQQPLYVQDFANDKNGITVNNRGEVGSYRNVGINEDIMSGAKFEPEVNIESEEVEEQMDMIGDGDDDLEHGTFNDLEDDDIDLLMFDLDEEDEIDSSLKESINESLDMFRRFKKY